MATVLYIDDTDADVELLRALLGQRGIHVDAALTGEKGISAYDPKRHAAVVIDWNLPDMEGPEVAKALLKQHGRCPIAFISGALEEYHMVIASTLHIDLCFEKKMNLEHIQRISRFIESSDRHAPNRSE